MMVVSGQQWSEVWLVDFEFGAAPGEPPFVVCLVAIEMGSGKKIRLWRQELLALKAPPYGIGPNALFVAYYASAELGCHLALGWPLPAYVLDLYAEFRNQTNGMQLPCGAGLLGALTWFGLDALEATEKDEMRALAQRMDWTERERSALLDYCESDVAALAKLLPRMQSRIDLPRALLRGRYMKAASRIEATGIPLDVNRLAKLRAGWESLQLRLIDEIDRGYHVYDGRTFKSDRFAKFLVEHDIPWPKLPSGALDLKDDTFREMARSHPLVAPLRELRVSLSRMRLSELAVGTDGRNRTLLSAFRSRTGRNQPSNSRFIFGPSVWLRGLIRPPPGRALAYVDWSQQEFGIAAALSGDPRMQEAYLSGDPYLAFAKQAGAAPATATKQSHKAIREQFKACVLAVQYGMGAESLALRIGQPVIRARELLRLHRETYCVFWRWSDGAVDFAMLNGKLWSVFGWQVHTTANVNPRFLRNFPMQGNGAEMLRLACCLLIENGIDVCAPVHDAVLVEAPAEFLSEIIRQTQLTMAKASATVLDGFELRSDVEVIAYPERYADPRGETMWRTVTAMLEQL